MKTWIKLAGTAALVVAAGCCAAAAIGDIRGAAMPGQLVESGYSYVASCPMEEAAYVLRDYDGYIGVFSAQAGMAPVTVTDIELRTLREADRSAIERGLAVSDRDELLSLLEDLGS